MKQFFCLLFLIKSFSLFSQTDYWSYQVYFSGCPINHIPKGITIPDHDKKSRAIMNAIISGDTYDQLLQKYPDSLDLKLEKLIAGKVIERNKNGFTLLFPVLVGKKRVELQSIIHRRISEKDVSLDSIILTLKQALPEKPEMIFHILWSRIMDECWWNLYNSTFQTEKGPPSIAFIVYPPHPYQCGTNSDYTPDNDMFAMSWSYNIFNESFSVPSSKSFFTLAANNPVPEPDRVFFAGHGLLDTENHALIFTYHEGDSLDMLCDSLKTGYANLIRGLFDYNELSKIFQISADDLFLLISHELAYELIGTIAEKKELFIPITLQNNPELNFKYLVSIRLH
jgi:hypothetical protein